MNLIAFWYEMSPERYFCSYGTGTFHCMELSKNCWTPEFKVILQMVISPGIFGTLEKNCWWLLHLASIFFFFIWKTCTVASVRRMCGVCGCSLCSRHSKKRDPVYCYKRYIRKIKGGKYHLIDKQLCPAWHFSNPSRTHIPEALWVRL